MTVGGWASELRNLNCYSRIPFKLQCTENLNTAVAVSHVCKIRVLKEKLTNAFT